jgi:type I restriction enzyme S subunit
VTAGFVLDDASVAAVAIPDGWRIRRLGELAQITIGRTPSRDVRAYWGPGHPWATIGDMRSKVVRSTREEITPRAASDMTVIPAGTLMMSFKLTIGKVAVAGRGLYSNEAICALRNPTVDSNFLYYALQRADFSQAGVQAVKGATLNSASLREIEVLVPPPAEQQRISAVLSDVDATIDGLETLVRKRSELLNGTTRELTSGRVRLPGFAGDWTPTKLASIGSTYGGLAGKTKDDFDRGDARYVPFISIIRGEVIDPSALPRVRLAPGESQNAVRAGDLFFNASSETPEEVGLASVLHAQVERVYLNSFSFGFRLRDTRRFDGRFLTLLFRGPVGRRLLFSLAQGATRYNLSKRAFLQLEPPVPPVREQTAIADALFAARAELEALQLEVRKLQGLKAGMMQMLLTGKARLA